jgi:hypothetical protein
MSGDVAACYSIEHEQLIKTTSAPYDALRCPVRGGQCPPPMPVS